MTLKTKKGKLGSEFSWKDDELQLPIQSALEFKSKCEFEGDSWESKRSKCQKSYDVSIKQYPNYKENYPNKDITSKDRAGLLY